MSFVSYSTPPDSPIYVNNTTNANNEVLFSLNTKDIAKYLTLADFYILKCITAQDYLAMYYPRATKKNRLTSKSKVRLQEDDAEKSNYIAMMTERANKLSQWVVVEVTSQKLHSKPRRTMIRKMIEIAKVLKCILTLFYCFF